MRWSVLQADFSPQLQAVSLSSSAPSLHLSPLFLHAYRLNLRCPLLGFYSTMAQSGPLTDVTQRLFLDLKSKQEETRVRASNELYDNVIAVSRGTVLPLVILRCGGLADDSTPAQIGLRRSSSNSTMQSVNGSRNSSSPEPMPTNGLAVCWLWTD